MQQGDKPIPEYEKLTLLHELGHSLGQLRDEYIEFAKGGYKPIFLSSAINGTGNIGSEGCPSWCSGEFNTDGPGFALYQEYKRCISELNIDNPDHDEMYKQCYYNATNAGLYLIDIGKGCMNGTGCYWLAGATNGFRSIKNSLMYDGLSFQLGAYNEQLVIKNINNLVNDKNKEISSIKLNLLDIKNNSFNSKWYYSTIYNNHDNPLPFKIEFKLLNQDDEPIIVMNNYRNYVLDSDTGLIFKNLETGNLELYFVYYLDSKHGQTEIEENESKDITFFVKYNNIEFNKTYKFYLYNLTFEDISINNVKCDTLGYRKSGEYCTDKGIFEKQLKGDENCDNNFECSSNVCISGKCISEGFLQKILNWFKKLFGE